MKFPQKDGDMILLIWTTISLFMCWLYMLDYNKYLTPVLIDHTCNIFLHVLTVCVFLDYVSSRIHIHIDHNGYIYLHVLTICAVLRQLLG